MTATSATELAATYNGSVVGTWGTNLTTAGRIVLTLRIDADAGSSTERVHLWRDGFLLNKTSGSLEMIYNTDVLAAARWNGPLRPVSGTWKDFL